MGRWLYGRARRVDGYAMRAYLARIGSLLRDARESAGVSVAELAAATGSHPATIHRIERGGSYRSGRRSLLRVDTLVRLALGLGISPRELIP